MLKELGESPDGVEIKLLSGRYGPYVSDGTINASVPRGTDPDTVDIPHAMELIRAREQKGPAKKRARKKKAAPKKRAKKKAAKKKAAKKSAPKKAAENAN